MAAAKTLQCALTYTQIFADNFAVNPIIIIRNALLLGSSYIPFYFVDSSNKSIIGLRSY